MKKNSIFIRQAILFVGLLTAIWVYPGAPTDAAEVEIPSSFNPVGSGARALGFGGAFIAVADDATAASWNPGGLTQLRKPECSVVGSFFYRGEDLTFGTNPEANGSHSVSDQNINYLSVTYPFEVSEYNMVFSLSYQHLYDFHREWEFTLKQNAGSQVSDDHWEYEQEGSLTAIGLSYCIRLIPQLSAGFTLNLWDDDLTPNNWKQRYRTTISGTWGGAPLNREHGEIENYSLSGFNFNIGMLWRINYKWRLGAVFKSPFTADVEHKIREISEHGVEQNYLRNEEMDMPMSYGIGIAHDFSDNFSISADIYRTEWDDYIYRTESGDEISPFTESLASESDIESTWQVRIGGEYRFINEDKGYLIPIRAGIFYDPAPAEESPDDFYGFGIGLGFTRNNWFSLDIAYQYRFGNDVGTYFLENREFSEDVAEHTVYASMILYRFF